MACGYKCLVHFDLLQYRPLLPGIPLLTCSEYSPPLAGATTCRPTHTLYAPLKANTFIVSTVRPLSRVCSTPGERATMNIAVSHRSGA